MPDLQEKDSSDYFSRRETENTMKTSKLSESEDKTEEVSAESVKSILD